MRLDFFGKAKLDKRQRRLYGTLVFLLRLLALSIPLYIIIAFLDLGFLQAWTVSQMVWLLNALGFAAQASGFLITVQPGFSFFISQDCTAWKSMLFFLALVLAVPKVQWKKRVLGLALGLPVIWIANLSRVVAIVWAQQNYGESAAMLLHDYLWGLGLVALVFVLWLLWLRFAKA
jgi:exosortase/archaeosortase family protein